jgi:hypothetical protein
MTTKNAKTDRIYVRISPQDRLYLVEVARRMGVKQSEVVRQAVKSLALENQNAQANAQGQ